MPNSLSIDQIQQLQTQVASGDIIGVYTYLSQQGYNYAGWAGGVAAGDTISGVAALEFMKGTALMGVGGPECQMLSAERIQSIKTGMAKAYLNTLLDIANDPANNGYVSRDINAEEVWNFHREVFDRNGLSIDNWTLNAPFQIIQKLEGEQGLDNYWSFMRDTKGADSYDAIVANLGTLAFMHKQTTSSDPEIRAMANAWLQNVPGIYSWDQIDKTLSNAMTAFGTKLSGLPSLNGDYDALGNFIVNLQDEFHTAEVTRSPLILDLNGNGVETISKTAAIHFDHDGNHFAETTGWVGKDDGLLVWDRNGNGKVDDGSELFGNNTNLMAGGKAANGFAALADLDSNHDGKIDANDTAFNQLRVWKDNDSNAVVSGGELLTLADAGIQSIGTGFTTQNMTDAQGNQHLQAGQYVSTDGTTHAIEDVWFAADTARTVDQDLVAVNATIAALPDLQGFGNVHSLHQAMARDTTGRLQSLVASFANETNADARAAIMTTLIYAWAGVEGIDPASRAATLIYGNAIGDARKLATLEAFLGEGYLGTWCWGARDPNPHGHAAPILIKAFDQLREQFSAQLMAQTQFKSLYDSIGLMWNATTSSFDIDVTAVVALLQSKFAADPTSSLALMSEFGRDLHSMGDFGVQTLNALAQKGDSAGTGFALQLAQFGWQPTTGNNADNTLYGNTDQYNTLSGLAGNDHLYGKNRDDILDGGSGDDWLFGDLGNDTIKGGTGNDYLVGGAGDDIYFFNPGDGQDTIVEYANEGSDILQIGVGLDSTSTRISRETMDLVLNFSATDSVRIVGYFNKNAIEVIQFADGTKWDYQTVASKLVYNGTAGNDTLTGLTDAPNVINGGDGNDTITGGGQTDVLNGEAGNDVISAGSGNASLTGGAGNDTLYAGSGIDTFVFNQGDGQDVINEIGSYSKTGGKNLDVLQLGAGLLAPATQVTRGVGNNSNDLTLVFGGGDQITLRNYFSSTYRLQTIQFADGTKWDYPTVASKLVYNGTAGNDALTGLTDAPNVINGGDGNDVLNAGTLNDTLAGGTGNDTLNAGVGIDTFVFNQGDGQDVINEIGSYSKTGGKNLDVLQLGAGLLASTTQVTRGVGSNSYDLTLVFGGGDQITVRNYFSSTYRLQTIQFADGTKWDYPTVASKLVYNGTTANDTLTGLTDAPNVINGGDGNDTITGGGQTDVLNGGTGNDVISAGNGNASLTGGTGNDTLNAGVGIDTFVFNQGDGQDVINEIGSYSKTGGKNLDVLQLGAGLQASATQVTRGVGSNSYDLTLVFGGGDQITVRNYFSSAYHLQTIQFADGTKWDYPTVASKLVYNGTAGNDTLTGLTDAPNVINGGDGNDVLNAGTLNDTLAGGTGNDTLNAGVGIDTFVFNQGDGQDVINEIGSYSKTGGKNLDVLQLGAGLLASATQVTRGVGSNSYDLTLVFGGGDQITLRNYFSGTYRLQTIQFADGTKWDYPTVASKLVYNGTAGNDALTGLTDAPNVINGGDGNDVLNAGTLNDTLAGGTGNDTLNAGVGIDTFVFNQGDGQDVINEIGSYSKTGGKNLDVLQLGAGLLASTTQVTRGVGSNSYDLTLVFGGGDQITVRNYFSSTYRLQTIQFADGTKWDYPTVASKLVYNGTAANDTLTGLTDAPNVINGGDGNDTITGGGQTDVLNGEAGNDVISAGNRNASLTGGTGNDTLNAGAEIDTFIFNQGDGQDVINEIGSYSKTGGKNLDVLQLGAGLQASATQVTRGVGSNSYDLTLVFGGGDQITLRNYFSSTNRLQTIQFADGTKWDYPTIASKLVYNGTAGNDTLTGLTDAPNVINGGDGNDTITGGGQTDVLNGEAGNDVISAGNGNASLTGGTGNDTLNAGVGIDTFVFNQGDGQDVINEIGSYSKTGGKNLDVLQLGAGLLASTTQVTRGVGSNSYDLTLVFGGGDQITVRNYFSSTYRLQTIQFADGTKWDYPTVASKLVYNGTTANDTLTGLTDAPNVINGGDGNDTITGGGQTDVLNGGTGNDVISAGNGNASLTGGTGNDTLNAGVGIDTFVFNQGDGQDVINEIGSYSKTGGKNLDVLQLGAGLQASATQVTRGVGSNSYDLTLVFGGGDQITVRNYFSSAYHLQTIQFADGTKWDYPTVASKLVYNGTAGNDTLTGLTDAPNVINGGDGNDVLNAGTLNDTLAGGTGNDTLNAGVGIDTFVFNQGDGQDVINEIGSYSKTGGKNLDVLQLGAGLLASATQVTRGVGSNSYDLTLVFGGGDQITLRNYFSSTYRLQTIQFADGTKWDYPTVASKLVYNGTAGNDALTGLTDAPNVINGGDGNDVLNAGPLNDTLAGGTGNDTLNAGVGIETFVFNQGDGQDVINEIGSYSKTGGKNLDVLQLGAGLLASATQVTRGVGSNSYDLTLVFGGGDQITLRNYFSSTYRLQTIQFADGTKWDYPTVASKLVYNGTAGNDTLTGLTDAPNVINGGDGNDTITGGGQTDVLNGEAGNDVISAGNGNASLTGGTGNDTLNAGAGIDTFVFNQGDGQDVINEIGSYSKTGGKNLDVLQLGAGLQASATQVTRGVGSNSYDLTLVFGGGDQITVRNYFSSTYRLQTIQFADGTKWDYPTVASKLVYNGTAANDTLTGLTDAPNVINGGDGNDTITGGGQTDVLNGEAGNDVISAGNGNASLTGGTGNDTLNAGAGIDTFIFNQGDGQDVINEIGSYSKTGGKNLDVLQLGAGLQASATQVTRGVGSNSYDLTLVFGGGDQITLRNYFSSAYHLQTIQFADGTKWDYPTVASKLVYNGTAGNDTLTGLTDAPNVINGGDGNDTITGGGQTDVLNGGAGNDVISAGNGNASLTGGAGNDTLNAGAGIDTFVFNQGDGQDVINEIGSYSKTGGKNLDVLQLGAGLLAPATQVTRGVGSNSYDLTLVFGGGDQITLRNYFSSANRLQTIQFADGTTWDYATVASKLIYNGTAGNDTLIGLTDAPNVINGGGGNDVLNAGTLNDTLAGGAGNDTLNAGVGIETFVFNRGDGQDVINEMASYSKTGGKNLDVLQLGAGIANDQLWFRHVGNNLEIDVIGTNDSVTVTNWYSGSTYHVSQVVANGQTLLDTQVENLVAAMASFSPPAAGQTTLPDNYRTDLAPALAANWK